MKALDDCHPTPVVLIVVAALLVVCGVAIAGWCYVRRKAWGKDAPEASARLGSTESSGLLAPGGSSTKARG